MKQPSVPNFAQLLAPYISAVPAEAIPAPVLDPEEQAKLFDRHLDAREQVAARTKNIDAVTSAMAEKFGEKAEEEFYKKGAELNLSQDELNNLAGTSPAAVLALFGTGSTKTGADVSVGGQPYTPGQKKEVVERNRGVSVLSGSTSHDVRAEYDKVKGLVSDLHAQGVSVADLTDPKLYRKYFGPNAQSKQE